MDSSPSAPAEPLPVEGYYRWQSRIYDATRWSFLFGRSALVHQIARQTSPQRLLEIGCGTGRNLHQLARRFPKTALTGLDVSADMLALTEKKLRPVAPHLNLLRQRYDGPVHPGGFDLVICAYSLSMFNPGWQTAIQAAAADLAPGGLFALVDFHHSRHPWFKRWMGLNHVRMEAHLLPTLQQQFTPIISQIYPAYAGLWEYLLFIGQKPH